MLGNKDRMTTHRRLSAVVRRISRGQPCGDEIGGMSPDCFETFRGEIIPIFLREPETAPKRGSGKAGEEVVSIHRQMIHPGHGTSTATP